MALTLHARGGEAGVPAPEAKRATVAAEPPLRESAFGEEAEDAVGIVERQMVQFVASAPSAAVLAEEDDLPGELLCRGVLGGLETEKPVVAGMPAAARTRRLAAGRREVEHEKA